MTIEKRIAITLPMGTDLQDTIDVVKWANDEGITDGWFADPGAPDGMTVAATLGPYATKMRIGMAIVPVYTRMPTVIAGMAMVLAQIFPGRFVLGLGSSSQTIIETFNGIPLKKPLTRVKETAIMVRQMLAGERMDFDGETLSSHAYRQPPIDQPPPIYLAGLRPKMVEMAAEFGDGVILNLWPRKALPRLMEHIGIGAARAGKTRDDIEVVNRSMVLVTDDRDAGRDAFRRHFGPYFANPVYNRYLKWCGLEKEAQGIAEGWAARDRAMTSAAMTDEMVDEIGIIGPAEYCYERVRADAENGIDTHIIAPFGDVTREWCQPTFDAFTPSRFSF